MELELDSSMGDDLNEQKCGEKMKKKKKCWQYDETYQMRPNVHFSSLVI